MKVLNNIKSEHVVAIDIETVRVEKNYDDLSEGYQSAWEYKNKQNGEIPDNLDELWEKTSSLYAEFSKVCAVSLVFLDKNQKLKCYEFYGDDELILLENLSVLLDKIGSNPAFRLLGHASKFFDFPFLAKRFVINGMDIPSILDSTTLKPWEQRNMCSNELWKAGGTGAGSSLQALCNCLAIPVSKVDLVGDEVGSAFYRGEYERIGRYCSYDAIATFNIIRKFKKETIFDFESTDYVPVFVTEKEEKNILSKLISGENVTKKEVEAMLEKLKASDNKEAAAPLISLIERYRKP